jgi:hypothetical protein
MSDGSAYTVGCRHQRGVDDVYIGSSPYRASAPHRGDGWFRKAQHVCGRGERMAQRVKSRAA